MQHYLDQHPKARVFSLRAASGSLTVGIRFYTSFGEVFSDYSVPLTTTATSLLSLYRTAVNNTDALLPSNSVTISTTGSMILGTDAKRDGLLDSTLTHASYTEPAGVYRLGEKSSWDQLWMYAFAAVSTSATVSGFFTDPNGTTLSEVGFVVTSTPASFGSLTTIPSGATGFMLASTSADIFWNTGGSPSNMVIKAPTTAKITTSNTLVGFGDLR